MRETAYLETSFFSFYFDDRPSATIVARREWTRQWWERHRSRYELITSVAVLDELSRGELPHRPQAHEFALTLPAVEIGAEALEIVDVYLAHRLMPKDPFGDAMHLALASFHKCDFLLTWNCQNLANANKVGHIRRLNTLLGLHIPLLVTPLELMEEFNNEAD